MSRQSCTPRRGSRPQETSRVIIGRGDQSSPERESGSQSELEGLTGPKVETLLRGHSDGHLKAADSSK